VGLSRRGVVLDGSAVGSYLRKQRGFAVGSEGASTGHLVGETVLYDSDPPNCSLSTAPHGGVAGIQAVRNGGDVEGDVPV
jgi:hypothetical protein